MDKNENNEPKLQDEVSAKFDLVGCKPGKYLFAGFGELDLTAISTKDAKSLIAAGFPYLKAKSKAPPETEPAAPVKPDKK
jgi:hypothetical protein